MRHKKWTEKEMVDTIKRSTSYGQVLRTFGLREAGGNYQTIRNVAKQNKISLSHFKGKGWSKGRTALNAIPLKNLLVKGCHYPTSKFKHRIFREGLLVNECSECGLKPEWNGKKLVLELDHKNGDHHDNRIRNLRILCPNCHSQTDNFRGRKLRAG